jgi:hypothetical protein
VREREREIPKYLWRRIFPSPQTVEHSGHKIKYLKMEEWIGNGRGVRELKRL